MADPTTTWGKEAVAGIAELRRGLALVENRVDLLRYEVKVATGLAKYVAATFGVAGVGAAIWIGMGITRLSTQVENLSYRVSAIEQKIDRIAPPTVAAPAREPGYAPPSSAAEPEAP